MAATSSLYGGGGGIKSIQRGSTAIGATPGGTSATATINAVDLAKSFVSASFKNGYHTSTYASYSYNMWATSLTGGATLTATTTITFYSGTYYQSSNFSSGGPTVYWEVIEYE